MKSCTFFGHKICQSDLLPKLENVLEHLICTEKVMRFYVGNTGEFDSIVLTALKQLKKRFPISIYVVLAYMPKVAVEYAVLPEGIEAVPPRFAIDYRNNYMLKQSDVVVCYVITSAGGAAKFCRKAVKQNKRVINLAKAE